MIDAKLGDLSPEVADGLECGRLALADGYPGGVPGGTCALVGPRLLIEAVLCGLPLPGDMPLVAVTIPAHMLVFNVMQWAARSGLAGEHLAEAKRLCRILSQAAMRKAPPTFVVVIDGKFHVTWLDNDGEVLRDVAEGAPTTTAPGGSA